MRIKAMVVSDNPEEYKGKDGVVKKTQVLSVLDLCASGARLKNTFDYTLSDTEKDKYAGKLMDKIIELDVTDLSIPFGTRLRARGHIVSVK